MSLRSDSHSPVPASSMAITTVEEFVEAIKKSRLFNQKQLDEVKSVQSHFKDPKEFARYLIKKGRLTPFQANAIFHGKGEELVLGQYHLLERLGEGGMGQVFKARHQRLDRIVALKVIRPERLSHPAAVSRFHREIRAAAQLSHPNIVMAFDADQVGQTHFFAMEYVPGKDLAKIVKERGPLPVDMACDFIRQAALGLQHAYERGLVHRDIKPANLLVTKPSSRSTANAGGYGTVKILDMGLARLRNADSDGKDDDTQSKLTQEGTVMGTPDFIAPEQAINSSKADIRADLYSLGCSFYFLLTGKVPFPGGTLMEKILRHRSDPPVPAEQIRPDIPKPVLDVLYKLLAKNPDERYQTPAEVAEALTSVGRQARQKVSPGAITAAPATAAEVPTVVTEPETITLYRFAIRMRSLGERMWRWRKTTIAVLCFFVGIILVASLKRSRDETSPLDHLDPARIISQPWHPEHLVAVFGDETRVQPDRMFAAAFDSKGALLAGGGEDNRVHIWDIATLNHSVLIPSFRGAVTSLAFSTTDRRLAAGSYDGYVGLWDLDDSEGVRLSWEAHTYGVNAVAFSPDGKQLATGGGDHQVKLWDLAKTPTAQSQLSVHKRPVLSLAFSPDGNQLASSAGDVLVWQLKKSEPRRLRVKNGAVYALAWSPDGKWLAAGGWDKSIRLWPMNEKKDKPIELKKHRDTIYSLAFSSHGKWLVSAGADGQVILWNVTDKKPLEEWSLPWPVRCVTFAPDNRHLATANDNGSVYILRLR
ncbi:MAG: hypothetical protein KatS3mg105_2381 [Gemmatales bacterium]|nr:MAG: hypothetical protein KatS3mg105_2381 [Gemmatales bacterium]